MPRKKLEDFKSDFGMLVEAGFIAVKQFDEVSATRIFHAAHVLNPESSAPHIGLGYIALNKLLVKEAMAIFKEVLNKEPENYLAKTFLGICYLLNEPKRQEGEEIIKEAMEKTDDETVRNLGSVSLEWADKDLKKMKAPFFITDEEVEAAKTQAVAKQEADAKKKAEEQKKN